MESNKVTLFLMSKKGLSVLSGLVHSGLRNKVICVISSRDNSIKEDYYDNISTLCKLNNILFYNKKENFKLKTKYLIAVAWRWIITLKNDHKLIVLHDSILPKYRGFSPLVNSLINKEKKVGVTALFATKKYDEGEIINQKYIKINYPIKIIEAINLISTLYSEIATELIKNITNIKSTKQNNSIASYSIWLDEEDYFIDWHKDADYISRFIDSVGYPYLGAKTKINSQYFTITKAELFDDLKIENRHVGKVLLVNEGFPVVVCGKGLLKIIEIHDNNQKSLLPLKKFRTRFK